MRVFVKNISHFWGQTNISSQLDFPVYLQILHSLIYLFYFKNDIGKCSYVGCILLSIKMLLNLI